MAGMTPVRCRAVGRTLLRCPVSQGPCALAILQKVLAAGVQIRTLANSDFTVC